jgi:predicted transcriptional regulator
MKQVLVQLDDELAERLEEIAPAKSHKRSEFVRAAIARALLEAMESRTRDAYARWPDEPSAFDPREWAPESEAVHPPSRRDEPRRRNKAR